MSENKFVSYADENTPYDALYCVVKISENDSIRLFKWLSDKKWMQTNIGDTSLLIAMNIYP